MTVLGQHLVNPAPQPGIDDGLMHARVPTALVRQLTEADAVAQQLVQVLLVDARARPCLTVLCRPRLGGDAIQRQVGGNLGGRADGQHLLEDAAHHRRLGVVDDQQAVLDIEAERRHATHPHPFALAGGDLVADALAGDLALELGEGQQDVEHQPPHRGGSVELLRDRHKRHAVALEHLDHLGEVGQAARQAVDLVDHHDVDLAALDVRHQAFQPRPIRVAAGEARVVVVVGHRNPTLGALAGDVGVASLLLRVDGVELLVKTLVRRHPAVDRAAFACLGRGDLGGVAHCAPALPFRPKNSGPDQ